MSSLQGDVGAVGPKGDKVRPPGLGQGVAVLSPPSSHPPLSCMQGDTIVVEGPAGARGSKGEPVRAGGLLGDPALGSMSTP